MKIISLFIVGAILLSGLAKTKVVEEVIVAATKTERTLQEVPVEVAAVNSWFELNNFTTRIFCHYGIGGVALIISKNK
jgi:hypothetical protein